MPEGEYGSDWSSKIECDGRGFGLRKETHESTHQTDRDVVEGPTREDGGFEVDSSDMSTSV